MLRKATAGLLLAALAGACGGGSPAPPEDDPAADATTTTTAPGQSPADSPAPAAPSEPGATTTAPSEPGATTTAPGPDAAPQPGVTTTGMDSVDDPAAVAATVPAGPLSPLTGLPVPDATRLDRMALAVKIDNHWNARPQSGILEGEAIVELVVESGITRFIALFHHSDTEWVGPIRSGRPTDWTVVRPLNGALAISGAQPWVTRLITRNGVPLIGDMGPPLTHRWGQRRAPHNLYLNTFEARRVAEGRGLEQTPPEPLFNWGPLQAELGSIATYIFFDWTDTMDATWIWDGRAGRYLRFIGEERHNWHRQQGDETEQIWANNLIVIRAERYRACPPSGSGSCVPAWQTTGSGAAMAFANGRYTEGTWERTDETEWFTLRDAAGQEMTIPPGRSWIMIYPENADINLH